LMVNADLLMVLILAVAPIIPIAKVQKYVLMVNARFP